MVSPAMLEEAIATCNEYRCPMATAEFVATTGATCTVRFEGPFWQTCCGYNYFEDLIYEIDAPAGIRPRSADERSTTWRTSSTASNSVSGPLPIDPS